LFQKATEKIRNSLRPTPGLHPRMCAVRIRFPAGPRNESQGGAAARRALELDGRLAEAHAVLAQCANRTGIGPQPRQEYQEALRLNPNHATSHHWYSLLLANREKFTEALAEIRKAQNVDPLSPVIQLVIGGTLYDLGRYDETLVEADKRSNATWP